MKISLLPLLLLLVLLGGCGSGAEGGAGVDADAANDGQRETVERMARFMAGGQFDQIVAELGPRAEVMDLDAEDWLWLAKARLGQNEVPKAVSVLRKGLEAFPADLEQSLVLSGVYQRLNLVSKALEILDDAAAEGAESSAYQLSLGVALGRQNRLKDATLAFQRAADLGADLGDVEYNLGLIRAAGGDHEGALGNFEAALSYDLSNIHAKREKAHTLLRLTVPGEELDAGLLPMVEEVLEVAPQDWRAWRLGAELLLLLGDPVAAQMYATRALEFSGNEATVETLYVQAARAAKKQLESEGILDPDQGSRRRGGPPIPASVRERAKAARKEAAKKQADSP